MGSFDDWAIADCTSTCNKGMVHMITMFTPLAHIDIGEYKNPFITFKLPQLPRFGSFLYPKDKREIPKKLLGDPKKAA